MDEKRKEKGKKLPYNNKEVKRRDLYITVVEGENEIQSQLMEGMHLLLTQLKQPTVANYPCC